MNINGLDNMEIKLTTSRKLGNVTCKTAEDIVHELENLKNEDNDLFIQSLSNAILENDMDIICGHIDWFRKKIGKDCLNHDLRAHVSDFYLRYFKDHTKNGEISVADFIGDALEHFG